jgi:hypothetical protein
MLMLAVQKTLEAGGGGAVGVIVLVIIVGIWGMVKWNTAKATRCVHCGHDNGISGFQAAICPACGRNKTVLNSKKARKR